MPQNMPPFAMINARGPAWRLARFIPALGMILAILGAASPARADVFDDMRARWTAHLTGGPLDLTQPDIRARVEAAADAARQRWQSMNRGLDRTCLWPDLANGKTSNVTIDRSYTQLAKMAAAYRTPGSRAADGTMLFGNRQLRQDIVDAMQWLYANWYNEHVPKAGNWFQWELSIPMNLTDLMVLMDADLDDTARSNDIRAILHFSQPLPRYEGANGMWQARVWVLSGVLLKNHAPDGSPRDWLAEVEPNLRHMCEYSTKLEGFYLDGTFIQHETHDYTGGYGAYFIRDLPQLLLLLAGTPWNPPNISNVYRWLYDAYEPCIYEMRFFDSVRGRELSRKGNAIGNAEAVTQGILLLAETAPEPHRTAFRRIAKEWILGNPVAHYLASASLADYLVAKRVVEDPAIARRGPLVGYYPFARGARTMVHRDGYAYSIAMYTRDRTTSHENGGENMRGMHTSDGWLQILDDDFTQFDDAWYATVNWARLPGITVVSGNLGNPAGMRYKNASDFAGGVALGADGVTGFELSPQSAAILGYVHAKKAWFTFADETVCLGAQIFAHHPEQKAPLETVVEQWKLNAQGSNRLLADGQPLPAAPGWSGTLDAVHWLELEGNAPGTNRGYFFPTPATLHAARENQSGSYSEIRQSGEKDVLTRPFLSVWFDHGPDPQDATYAYVLLPGKTAPETQAYAARPEIRILENSGSAQAVEKARTGETGFVFWNAQPSTVQRDGRDLLSCDAPAAIMLAQSAGELAVAVSDPTQQNKGTIRIEIFESASAMTMKDAGVEVLATSPTIKLEVNVADAKGLARRVKFAR
jgi:hyaluronate lyase